jgi:drug/metabolite transporter (DMT)-like permease
MLEKNLWLVYVACAGLAWGTYVPIIFYGGSELGGKANARLMAILCVGGAYFVIGVLFPLVMFLTGRYPWPEMKGTGLVFSSLAGVAGAVGAICVIFASKAAVEAATAAKLPPPTYRVFIAPLIFGLAPVINVLVSTVWHPRPGNPWHFELELPGWKLWVGIVLVGLGAALVLFSKEEAEAHAPKAAAVAPAPAAPGPGAAEHVS